MNAPRIVEDKRALLAQHILDLLAETKASSKEAISAIRIVMEFTRPSGLAVEVAGEQDSAAQIVPAAVSSTD